MQFCFELEYQEKLTIAIPSSLYSGKAYPGHFVVVALNFRETSGTMKRREDLGTFSAFFQNVELILFG